MHGLNYAIFEMQIWLTGEGHVWLNYVSASCLYPGYRRRRLRIMGKLMKHVRKNTREVLFSNYMYVSVLSSISLFYSFFSFFVIGARFYLIFVFISHVLGCILI